MVPGVKPSSLSSGSHAHLSLRYALVVLNATERDCDGCNGPRADCHVQGGDLLDAEGGWP